MICQSLYSTEFCDDLISLTGRVPERKRPAVQPQVMRQCACHVAAGQCLTAATYGVQLAMHAFPYSCQAWATDVPSLLSPPEAPV